MQDAGTQQVNFLQVAYGPEGVPSKALLGFCKKNGVQADTVFTEADSKGTEYVWAVVKQPGRATAEVCDGSNGVFCNVLLLLLLSTLYMLLVLECCTRAYHGMPISLLGCQSYRSGVWLLIQTCYRLLAGRSVCLHS